MKYLILFVFLVSNNANATDFNTVTSGGVSLGSYSAGYLSYLINFRKINREKLSFSGNHIFAGASAGAVNSFAAGVSLCSPQTYTRVESPIWKVWENADFWKLYSKKLVTYNGIFSFEKYKNILNGPIEQIKKGLKENCSFLIGISVSHKEPYNLNISEHVSLPKMEDHFIFKIKGNGIGKPLTIKNFNIRSSNISQLLMPFEGSNEVDLEMVRSALISSASFPVAAPPTKLNVCQQLPGKFINKCSKENSTIKEFIDGGIFDNSPLLLSHYISKASYNYDHYFYLSANNRDYPEPKVSSSDINSSLLFYGANLAGNFVNASRNQEVVRFLEEVPNSQKKTIVNKTHLPPISSPMYAFFGFLDVKFREFDYYLGMADARSMLGTYFKNVTNYKLPENEVNENWALYRCVRKILENKKINSQNCLSNELSPEYKILLQVTLNRLKALCSESNEYSCKNYSSNINNQFLTPNLEDFSTDKVENETEEMYVLRLLDSYNFPYKDISKHSTESSYKKKSSMIYEEMRETLDTLRSKQPSGEKPVWSVINKSILSYMGYVPRFSRLYINVGTQLEFGTTLNFYKYQLPKWFEFTTSFYIDNYEALIGNTSSKVTLTPTIGFSIKPKNHNIEKIDFSYNFQFGYQLSPSDSAGTKICEKRDYERDLTMCSTIKSFITADATLFDILFLRFGITINLKESEGEMPVNGIVMAGVKF